MSSTDTKELLTREIVVDVLESIGIDVVGNKCKLREEERTHSVKIYNDGGLYDYGSGKHYDVFAVLIEFGNMDFRSSINYVRKFI